MALDNPTSARIDVLMTLRERFTRFKETERRLEAAIEASRIDIHLRSLHETEQAKIEQMRIEKNEIP